MELWRIFSRLKLSLALYQAPPWLLTAEQLADFEPRYARQLTLESRIEQQALAQGLSAAESDIQAAVAALDQRLNTAAVEPRQLARLGLDARGLYQAMTHEVLLDKMLARVAAQAPVPDDAEVARWYLAHQAKFLRPEQRECSHILLTVDDEQPGCRLEQARPRIEALHRLLHPSSGKDSAGEHSVVAHSIVAHSIIENPAAEFARLAQRHSECPTALDGGNLGWISRGLLYESLERVLFTLPAGRVSDIVTSPMGLHLLLCRAIRPAAPIPREHALATVRRRLQTRERQRYQRQWLNAL